MSWPADAVAAVTHPDPYPYYASLGPLARHEPLGTWVAARAGDVSAVLQSDACRVRPPGEPVPAALVGTAAGSVFGRLVRMNDGPAHVAARRVVEAGLSSLEPEDVAARSRDLARARADALDLRRQPWRVMELAFEAPARVVGGLLSLDQEPVAAWTHAFVRGIASGADDGRRAAGARAADQIERALTDRLGAGGLLSRMARAADRAGEPGGAAVVANALGLLSQAYDATAGLIGNALVALGRDEALRAAARADAGVLPELLGEVLRHDPPVQNTRRFVTRDGTVAGARVEAGDAILVVLAAANRDPSLNREPDAFRLDRPDRRSFSFGSGAHACPGGALAAAIARGCLEALRAIDLPFEALREPGYRPSVNARIPAFDGSVS